MKQVFDAGFLLGLLSDLVDGGGMFLRNFTLLEKLHGTADNNTHREAKNNTRKSGSANTKIFPLTVTKEMFQVLALYGSLTFLTNLKVLNFYAT
jgi:hypothetical protein